MPEVSTHPDSDLGEGDDAGAATDRPAATRTSRWQLLVGAVGLLVVLWVGSQMYDVVFFDGFGPGAGEGTPAVDPGPGGGGTHTGPPVGGHP